MEYTLIVEASISDFEQTVLQHLADGWKLYGGLVVIADRNFCREMVRGYDDMAGW